MHRFYADGLGEIGSLVTLSEEDARHASRVLRMQPGDAAELFLDGRRFSAEIAEMTAEGVTARLISELPSTEATLRITLYQGLPKAEKMELIVFDPIHHSYIQLGEKVGNAFSDGKALK